jgi:starvation-inducible DNA-binding protein
MARAAVMSNSTVEGTVQDLEKLLADTYVLYVKTQNYHWNLVDPRFSSLHKFFEEQYEELAEAVDEIAERIRMLNHRAPGSMRSFLAHTRLEESEEELDGRLMVEQLLSDHEVIIDELRKGIAKTSERGDEGTADLMVQRLRAHEKQAWMLRSTREED